MIPMMRKSVLVLVLATAACEDACPIETFLDVAFETALVVGDEVVPQSARLSGCKTRELPVTDLRWSSEDETVISIRADSLGFKAVGVGTTMVQVRYVGPGRENGSTIGYSVSVEGPPAP